MHCGILTVDHKKMSKSRGNSATFREVQEKFPADVIRFYLLSGHYRMPLEFTDEALKSAQAGLTRIKTCVNNLRHAIAQDLNYSPPAIPHNLAFMVNTFREIFLEELRNDFNTADAISVVFNMVKFINVHEVKYPSTEIRIKCLSVLSSLMDILGIQLEEQEEKQEGQDDSHIESLITQRQEARKNKDFAEADRIRNQLTEMGIILEDTREGIRWHRA
jgi:cysteinyl-tRNA synthetase